MKRDARLHGLTSDHHHALVLVRQLREACRSGRAADGRAALQKAFPAELAPHFGLEEEVLLPGLFATRPDLCERTLDEHRRMRALVGEVGVVADPAAPLERFAALLEAHVRFEESELFAACEQGLDDATLARVAERRPHRPSRRDLT
jgi:hypothetical protein